MYCGNSNASVSDDVCDFFCTNCRDFLSDSNVNTLAGARQDPVTGGDAIGSSDVQSNSRGSSDNLKWLSHLRFAFSVVGDFAALSAFGKMRNKPLDTVEGARHTWRA